MSRGQRGRRIHFALGARRTGQRARVDQFVEDQVAGTVLVGRHQPCAVQVDTARAAPLEVSDDLVGTLVDTQRTSTLARSRRLLWNDSVIAASIINPFTFVFMCGTFQLVLNKGQPQQPSPYAVSDTS